MMNKEEALNLIKQALEVATRHGAFGIGEVATIVDALKVLDDDCKVQSKTINE